ncbi:MULTISPECIES: lactaldehyde reductase [Aerococcus]|uniref:lactaldehyde reductase n=1 Tax=Aerococcus TaxID=1375 RepID=UPI0018A6F18C|nr:MULTISPECIES: lactaldehyde reductase [Aerococcus]MCY3036702.1 lactaldehyde reductase [Aerococcus sp. Group 2]MCY3039907.1 lactaldehyde reductase [Aerococcus sp. Group 2]MCY3041749.1 lactaldehyde reductase [Aerococcus sp. Group 2]MCY3043365.1 lactaldehyde reductase [Aerococcus sp. Group 2]MDK6521118.1 lactaldehyde reductase [Aerococcus urinae]
MTYRMILNERSYFGPGAIQHIPEEFRGKDLTKAAVITDRGLVDAGVVRKVTDLLDENDIPYDVFDQVEANPSVNTVKAGVDFVKESGADCIIAIGGGSSMDTSKAVGIIIENPEFADVVSLEGTAPTKNKAMMTFAVPTTAGTGAEVTINYVITDTDKKRKFVCVDPNDIPDIAFVDSEMMMSMPKKLTAATGMDALTHAIEGYITPGAWEMSDMVHIKAIEMIGRSIRKAVEGDPKAKEDMASAQYIAAMGYSNVGLGLVHGMSHPLSAWYGIPHGQANAILLPVVMRYNKDYTGEKFRDIAKALGVEETDTMSIEEARDAACQATLSIAKDVGMIAKLSDLGVKAEDIPLVAKDAMADVCTPGNPRPAQLDEVIELYQSLM